MTNRIPLFCLVTMMYWFAMYTCVPILVPYVEQLGASHRMAGLIIGSYGFVQMLLRFPVGIASDRYHKRRLFITFGLAFTFISGIGLWLTKDMTLILIFRGLTGAAAATWVDFTILFASYYKREEVTKAISTMNFYNSMGIMTAMLVGGWMAERYSMESTFLIGGFVGFIGMFASYFLVEKFEENRSDIPLREDLNYVLKDRTLITVSILAIFFQVLNFTTVFGFTPVFAELIGATKFEMGLLGVFSFLPTAFASIIGGGMMSRKFGEKNVIILGFMLMGVFTLTIPFTSNFVVLLVTQALSGLGRGFCFPLLMALSIKHMPMERRTTAMGFFQAVYGLGMFAGPFIIGWIGDTLNLQWGFIMLGILSCLTAGLCQIWIRQRHQPLPAPPVHSIKMNHS